MRVLAGRYTSCHTGPLAIFVIGMRINYLRKVGKWWPVARSMPPMIAELAADPQSGFLGAEFMRQGLRTLVMLQYWRDFDHLEAYARDRDRKHWPAWTAFNKTVGNDGTVGIFHETYCVPCNAHETIYANMAPWGLGRTSGTTPAIGSREAARSRMAATADSLNGR